jgi:hypothetical protein
MQSTTHRQLANRVIRLVLLYRRRVQPKNWPDATVDPAAIAKHYYEHSKRTLRAIKLGIEAFHCGRMPVSPVAAFCYLATDHGHTWDSIEAFMKSLCCEQLEDEDPRTSLRRIMRTNAIRQNKYPDHEILAYTIKTFNLHNAHTGTEALLWNQDNGMPRFARPRE